MSKQRYINTKFWSDNWISDLDPVEKLLFLYLLTNEKTNIAGIYELPLKIMAVETGIEKEMIEKIIIRFDKDNKVIYKKGWVYIKNFIKHQDVKNPKIKIGIKLILDNIPNEIKDTLSIPYIYPPNNSNTNSNSNSNIPIGIQQADFGLKDINQVIDFLKDKLGGSPDGSIKENRRYAKLLLDKFKKDYPDKEATAQIQALIDFGLKDKFHGKNITSFKYLYHNSQKIIQSIKITNKPNLTII